MRLFIAITLSAHWREQLDALTQSWAEQLQPTEAKIQWVRAPQFHITLKFLGDCAESSIETLRRTLTRSLASEQRFTVEVTQPGTFPERGAPRVLWLGVGQGKERLNALAGCVESVCAPLGFQPEGRDYNAHLTLGRVKHPGRANALREALAQCAVPALEPLDVGCVDLMRSHLGPQGSRYEELDCVRLAS